MTNCFRRKRSFFLKRTFIYKLKTKKRIFLT